MPVTAAVVDTFNRANAGNLGANWTADPFGDGASNVSIGSNAAVFSFYCAAAYNAATYLSTQDIEFATQIKTMPSGSTYGLGLGLIRQLGAGTVDGYLFSVSLAGTVTPEKYTDGAAVAQSTSTLVFQDGDLMIVRRRTSDGRMQLIRDRAGAETVAATWTDTTFAGPFNLVIVGYDPGGAAALEQVYAANLTGTTDATVTAPAAAGTGDVPNPTVVADAAVSAPAADGTGDIPGDFPVSSAVDATAATGTGDLPNPAVTGTTDATVTSPAAAGAGDVPAPGAAADAAVSAPAADGTGDVPAPGAGSGGSVVSSPAAGAGSVPAPSVVGGSAQASVKVRVDGAWVAGSVKVRVDGAWV